MKRTLQLLVLLLCLNSIVIAQQHDTSQRSTMPEHPAMKYLSIFDKVNLYGQTNKKVNSSFQLDEVEEQLLVDGNWIPYQRTGHFYDAGNRVESIKYVASVSGGEWSENGSETYSYTDGLLTTITTSTVFNGVSENLDRTLISYQFSGGTTFPESVTYQFWDSSEGEWVNQDRSNITVENGLITGGSYDEWDFDRWAEIDRYTLEQVGDDLVETIFVYDSFSEEWVNDEQIVYPGITVETLYEQFINLINLIEDGTLLYLFDTLPPYTTYMWMDNGETGEWVPTDRQIMLEGTELENGATTSTILSMEENMGDSKGWVPYLQVLTGFNDGGQPVAMSFFSPSDQSETSELVKTFGEFYTYNSDDLIEIVEKFGASDFGGAFKAVGNSTTANNSELSGRAVLTWSGLSTSNETLDKPLSYSLKAAYPNPFNPSTVIPYELSNATDVSIEIFDMLGRRVGILVDEFKPAGFHTVRFDGSGLSSGVYMIRMNAAGIQQTRSVSLIK